MKIRDLESYSRDVVLNDVEDMESSRKKDKLVRKQKDKKRTKERKLKRKHKTRGYYV